MPGIEYTFWQAVAVEGLAALVAEYEKAALRGGFFMGACRFYSYLEADYTAFLRA